MLKPYAVARPAAALAAAALLLFSVACGDDDGGTTPSPSAEGSGAASGSPPAATPGDLAAFVLTGSAEGELLTGSHSLALGDFNDDGELDLLAGAPQSDGPDGSRLDGGAAYVILGPLGGQERHTSDADVTIYGSFAGDNLGYATLAGDLNGDGVDDVLVGAPGVTAGFDPRTDQGRVYVFYGGPDFGETAVLDLQTDVFDFTVTGSEGFSRLSNSMAMGDINGDNTGDLVVAAPFAGREPGTPPGGPRTTVGEVYVIFGGDLSGEHNMARDEYDVLISGKEAQGQFGGALAVADFNGDGNDDIAIAAHRSSAAPDRLQSGIVYVFSGSGDMPPQLTTQNGDEDASVLGPAASDAFGFPMAAGDFDGDGTPDLAAGAQLDAPEGLLSAGSIRIISGDELSGQIDLLDDDVGQVRVGTEPGQLLPSSLAAVEWSEDQPAALVVGSQLETAGDGLGAGNVYVYDGVSEDWTPAHTASGAAGDRLGNAVAAAPIDSGYAVAMLAPGADGDSGNDLGAVTVYFYVED